MCSRRCSIDYEYINRKRYLNSSFIVHNSSGCVFDYGRLLRVVLIPPLQVQNM